MTAVNELSDVLDIRENLKTLIAAAKAGRLAVAACYDTTAGQEVPVLVTISDTDNGGLELAPFAVMFTENPYDRLLPPGELPN